VAHTTLRTPSHPDGLGAHTVYGVCGVWYAHTLLGCGCRSIVWVQVATRVAEFEDMRRSASEARSASHRELELQVSAPRIAAVYP
jgi:hypothetical protein